MVSENPAGDATASRSAAASSPRTAGRSGLPSALRAMVEARLEELPFSRGVMLIVTTGLALVAVVVGTTVVLTSGGTDAKEPRSAAPPPPSTPAAGPTGHSPTVRASHRRPKTSSSTVVGSAIPSPSASRPASPSASPTQVPGWPPADGHPHWPTPPPWWHHR